MPKKLAHMEAVIFCFQDHGAALKEQTNVWLDCLKALAMLGRPVGEAAKECSEALLGSPALVDVEECIKEMLKRSSG